MDHKTSYKILRIGLIGGAAVLFAGLLLFIRTVFWLGVGIMAAATLQAWKFWKCPFCGKRLNVRGRRPDYCPFCDHDLGFNDGKEYDGHH